MNHIKFLGTGDGVVDSGIHFPAPGGNDFTLCGLTLDEDPLTAGDYKETMEKVDCEYCIQIVEFCKKISKTKYHV